MNEKKEEQMAEMVKEKTEAEPTNSENNPQEFAVTGKACETQEQKSEEAEDESEESESFFSGIPDQVEIEFHVSYDDVIKGLNHTDKQDGTTRKKRIRYMLVMAVAALELIAFMQSKSGFALIFAIIFCGLGIYINKKSSGVNHRIATAFAEEEQQTFFVNDEQIKLSNSPVDFSEVVKLFETDDCFSMVYQRNRVFIIPKRLLTEQECYGVTRKLKSVLGDTYENFTTAQD